MLTPLQSRLKLNSFVLNVIHNDCVEVTNSFVALNEISVRCVRLFRLKIFIYRCNLQQTKEPSAMSIGGWSVNP